MGNLLWIGSYLNDEMALRMRKFGYGNPASVLSQKNILEGIEAVTGKHFNTIGALALNGYPKEKVKYLKKCFFSHAEGTTDTLVGFLNIRYLNKVLMGVSLKKEVKKQLKSKKKESLDVFVYEMRSACLRAAKEVKKLSPSSRIHLIVPDLPQFMDLQSNKLKKIFKRIDWKSIQKNLQYVDDYILYAAPMAEYLGLEDGSWMVMEGSICQKEIDSSIVINDQHSSRKYIVMYSGSIQKGFGIQNLLDATQLLDDSYEFWFTGGGDYKNVVCEYATRDSRIKYLGFLPTYDDVKRLQMQATMLINMRDSENKASTYCFPSKLLEYMLLGKPVLSCRLGGIPEEYFDYLIEIKSLGAQDIADSIKKAKELIDGNNIGQSGREFIIREKSSTVQAKKILDFINL